MRQLTSLDAQFLAIESPRQYGHTSGLAVLDPSTAPGGRLDLADVQRLILERLPLLPPFRWRLVEVPLNLDFPYWVDDENFDIDFHVRELALVPPGNLERLADQVGRIFSRPLDRSRPLWEAYLIHGIEGGRVGLMTKIHHAVIDGMSGAEILSVLLDLSPEGRPVPTEPVERSGRCPTDVELLARGLLGLPRYPLRALRSLPRALPNIDEVGIYGVLPGAALVGGIGRRVERLLGRRQSNVEPVHLTPPRTPFNGSVSAHRRIVLGTLPLDEVKGVKNSLGCTVNDVVVAICAGAVRRWLLQHDALPDEPLVAQIPVSVRTQEQQGTFGNRILLMSAPLFTDEPEPLKRLRRTHEALADMKERHRALPADLLQDANNFIPPAVFSRAARLSFALSRTVRPTWNLVISNVPGPQFPLYCAGARLDAMYPISVVTDGMGLNITVMSYNGRLDFGLVADREMIPDVRRLMDWLRDSLDELMPPASRDGAAGAPRRPAARATSNGSGPRSRGRSGRAGSTGTEPVPPRGHRAAGGDRATPATRPRRRAASTAPAPTAETPEPRVAPASRRRARSAG